MASGEVGIGINGLADVPKEGGALEDFRTPELRSLWAVARMRRQRDSVRKGEKKEKKFRQRRGK